MDMMCQLLTAPGHTWFNELPEKFVWTLKYAIKSLSPSMTQSFDGSVDILTPQCKNTAGGTKQAILIQLFKSAVRICWQYLSEWEWLGTLIWDCVVVEWELDGNSFGQTTDQCTEDMLTKIIITCLTLLLTQTVVQFTYMLIRIQMRNANQCIGAQNARQCNQPDIANTSEFTPAAMIVTTAHKQVIRSFSYIPLPATG